MQLGDGDGDARLPRFTTGTNGIDGVNGFEGGKTIASIANSLNVYEDAVQEPLLECTNLASMYYNAQEIGSRRPDARILREDFCSSAIVAQTWLALDRENRSQGVDIDSEALRIAHKRVLRSGRRACLIQSTAFSNVASPQVGSEDEIGETSLVDTKHDQDLSQQANEEQMASSSSSISSSTWDQGAASDRFERRFQARKAKALMAEAKKRAAAGSPVPSSDDKTASSGQGAPKNDLTLLHADVLSLPLDDVEIEAPDLVYSGNYALSYFHDRKSLLAYLAQCRRTLRPETGVLVVDPFAGPTNWEPKDDAERQEQDTLWSQFATESGFLRQDEAKPPAMLRGDNLEFWKPLQPPSAGSDWKGWPRGRLVLVRKGHLHGGYEYWREDGPIDYVTNRFRMSLSFRFRDGSWLRDYFSYDFRVWSLREITEAMEEVGFERIEVHAIPRLSSAALEASKATVDDSMNSDTSIERSEDESQNVEEDDEGLSGMAGLIQRTEKQETGKIVYQHLEQGQKLFAAKSFGTYIIACMPSKTA